MKRLGYFWITCAMVVVVAGGLSGCESQSKAKISAGDSVVFHRHASPLGRLSAGGNSEDFVLSVGGDGRVWCCCRGPQRAFDGWTELTPEETSAFFEALVEEGLLDLPKSKQASTHPPHVDGRIAPCWQIEASIGQRQYSIYCIEGQGCRKILAVVDAFLALHKQVEPRLRPMAMSTP